jgi:hypothetical protein
MKDEPVREVYSENVLLVLIGDFNCIFIEEKTKHLSALKYD